MGKIGDPPPVKLFVGLITGQAGLVSRTVQKLSETYGPIDLRSDVYAFDATHYYDKEMGSPLFRSFFSFATLIDPEWLARIKTRTNAIEAEFTAEKAAVARPINLDPGYIEEAKIVLASTKNFYHRILISERIYAEVTLHYEAGRWRPFPWTFPDFRTGRYDPFFTELRRIYREQLKAHRAGAEAP